MGSLFLFTIFTSYTKAAAEDEHHTHTHTPNTPPPTLRTSLFTNTNSDSSASLHSPASPTCPPRRLIPEMET